MKAKRPLLLCLFLFAILGSYAQSQKIYLSSGILSPQNNINAAAIDSFNLRVARLNSKTSAIIQFSQLPDSLSRGLLKKSGIELIDYLPDNAYTVTISGRVDLAVLQKTGAVALLQLRPEHKLESRLRSTIPSWASKIAGTVDLWTSVPKGFADADVRTALRTAGFELLPATTVPSRGIYAIRIAINRLMELAALPFIEYVQLAPRGDQPLNYNSRYASRASLLNASISNGGKGLRGEGVVIGVGDNADVQTHIDFSGRLYNRSSNPANGHGHHVTGTVGGNGNGNDFYRGYAPKAKLVIQDYNGILRNADAYVSDYGMVITNNSYGDNVECTYHGTYDLYSRWMDELAISQPFLENIFAAGNSGGTVCAPFPPGYHTVLGGYQSAKNVLVVGATNDSGAVSGFSSRGPVRDGRMKPEITAMGQFVASTWPTSYYSYNNGTSMACPGVAGGMGLLYQRYRQLNGGNNPKNMLMKAIMCNGASDRGPGGPDYQYGFGWMNLLRSVEMIENNRFFIASGTNGSVTNHSITVPPNTAQVKVMLCWNDPAASPLAAKTLVNDLDLEVIDGSTHLPLISDSTTANLGNAATEAADHMNNIEQVVLANPAAGNLTLRVKGTAVTQASPQEYALVYDFIPASTIRLTSPAGGETWVPSSGPLDIMKISWDAYGFNSGTVTLEFSADNGLNWSTVASGVNINRVVYSWYVPNVITTTARIRITRDGSSQSVTSNQFSITPLLVISQAAVQCEGYINVNWTPVAGADDYEAMILRGEEMTVAGVTTATSFSFSGLSKDSTYWVTVRPRIGGISGRRAVAISRQAIGGSCAGSISDNDLKIDAILSPVSGRQFTSSQPSSAATVSVRIKNLDDAPVSNFDVKYRINGGAFVTETVTATIAAGATYTHVFSTPANLSSIGNYSFNFVVAKTGDAVAANDSATTLVRHLPNAPLNLASAFTDNMETAAATDYLTDTLGLFGLERYDFSQSTIYGRLRTFLNSGMASSGAKAITLDVDRYLPSGNTNYLTGTYNLVNYTTAANDLRLDFKFNNHGQAPHINNKVWIRGSDADNWIEAYQLSAEQADPGMYKKTGSIEIADLLAANGQSFTPSFAVRWGQWGQLAAADLKTSGGYSFDDVRIYQVFNDLQMRSIDAPVASSCGLTNTSTITVTVRNSANTAASNVPVRYHINNGAWSSATIASIPANTSQQFSFPATADLSALGSYTITALVDGTTDSFRENDTLSTAIVNSPVISSFPHLQNFETGTSFWYTGGKRSSWEEGTPASAKITGAASGARAWKTRLTGNYNDNELSYLYSPCYNISSLTKPTLSFSVALDIEDCGTVLCDAAWVEYSADGVTWAKLNTPAQGFNWYNKTTDAVWSIQNYTNWHVATMALPTGLSKLRLRFVFNSDPGVNREGMAIDDIHIYDNSAGIYDGPTTTIALSRIVPGSGWTDFTSSGKLVASVHGNGQDLGATDVQAFINATAVRYTSSQYYHDRNITIKPANSTPADSAIIRFYFLDMEVDSLLKATGCAQCSKPSSAYRLGISQYSDVDRSFENGSIGDNNSGTWNFLTSDKVTKVPFDKGYYAEFKVKGFSEFWLNAGGLNGSTPLPVKLMDFIAAKQGGDVLLSWKIGGETSVDRYEVELARGAEALQSGSWSIIGSVASLGNTTSTRNYSYTDIETGKNGVRYYRIKTVNADGSSVYSPVRSVSFDAAALWQLYPNPSTGVFFFTYLLNNSEVLTARIIDAKGSLVKEYRRVGSGQFEKLQLDLTMQASGVYLLQVHQGEQKRQYKLYKQ